MVVVITFNVWLIVSVIIGKVFGQLLCKVLAAFLKCYWARSSENKQSKRLLQSEVKPTNYVSLIPYNLHKSIMLVSLL